MKSKVLDKLKKRVETDPQIANYIAMKFGYKSSGAVMNWITRNKIPFYREKEVSKYLFRNRA